SPERNRDAIHPGSQGLQGARTALPSLRRTAWRCASCGPVERLTPTSRRVAASVEPCAKSFMNCWRLADCAVDRDVCEHDETTSHQPPQTSLVLHRLMEPPRSRLLRIQPSRPDRWAALECRQLGMEA